MGVGKCSVKNTITIGSCTQDCASCTTQTCARSQEEHAIECMRNTCTCQTHCEGHDEPIPSERLTVLAIPAITCDEQMDTSITAVAGNIFSCEKPSEAIVDTRYEGIPVPAGHRYSRAKDPEYSLAGHSYSRASLSSSTSTCDQDYEELVALKRHDDVIWYPPGSKRDRSYASNILHRNRNDRVIGNSWQNQRKDQWREFRQDLAVLSNEVNSSIPRPESHVVLARSKTRKNHSNSPHPARFEMLEAPGKEKSRSSSTPASSACKTEIGASMSPANSAIGASMSPANSACKESAPARKSSPSGSRVSSEVDAKHPDEAADLRAKIHMAERQSEECKEKTREAMEKTAHLEHELNAIKAETKQINNLKLVQEIAELQDRYHTALVFLGKPAVEDMERELEKEKVWHDENEIERVKQEEKKYGRVLKPPQKFGDTYYMGGRAAWWAKQAANKLGIKASDSLQDAVLREKELIEKVHRRYDDLRSEIELLQRQQEDKKKEIKNLKLPPITAKDKKPIEEMEIHRDEIMGMLRKAMRNHSEMEGIIATKHLELTVLNDDHQKNQFAHLSEVKKQEGFLNGCIAELHKVLDGEKDWHHYGEKLNLKLTDIRDHMQDLLIHIKNLNEMEFGKLRHLRDL